MTLTNKQLNIVCIGTLIAVLLSWVFGANPLFAVLVGPVIYGFHNLQDILGQRVAEADENVLFDAISIAQEAHNRDISDSLSLFVTPIQEHSIGVQPLGEAELQGVDQWGRPDPIRFPVPARRSFPLFMAQTSIAINYVLSQKMTVQELNDRLRVMFTADAKWLRRQLLSALFTNAAYNFSDDRYGTYAVSVLANGDTETYLRSGSAGASVDTHHKGSAAFDAAMVGDVRTELVEHDENGGSEAQVVMFVPTSSRAAAQALPGFVKASDPNVSTGGAGVNEYTGSFAAIAPGVPLGYDEDNMVHIREWDKLPANYVVGVTNSSLAPLAMREDAEASLRGFGEIPGREDMPYMQRIWSRRAGFGSFNRIGAVVYRTNNAAYAVPSGFQAPN